MQISLTFKGILAALVAISLIVAGALFVPIGTASADVKETKAAFALNADGTRVAYHFAQASAGGIRRGIRIHDAVDGGVIHVIQGDGDLQVHSPVFDRDGRTLIMGTICWSDNCPKGLAGSRLISLDLGNGTWRVLTDDGYRTPFWDFGYVNQSPEKVTIQAMRSDPVVTPDGTYYLVSAANVREITAARDFAPRRLTPADEYILTDSDGAVAFRGHGSMAPFGPDALLIVAGAARGGLAETDARSQKTFAYLITRKSGAIRKTWTMSDVEAIGLNTAPSPRTAAGDAARAQGYVVAGKDIVRLSRDGLQVFYAGGTEGDRIRDIALSGDGKLLFVATPIPDSDVPALRYFTLETEAADRSILRLNAASEPKNIITIQ